MSFRGKLSKQLKWCPGYSNLKCSLNNNNNNSNNNNNNSIYSTHRRNKKYRNYTILVGKLEGKMPFENLTIDGNFFHASTALMGQGRLIVEALRPHSHTGLLWTSDQPVAETST
jgi:hypothetical protein